MHVIWHPLPMTQELTSPSALALHLRREADNLFASIANHRLVTKRVRHTSKGLHEVSKNEADNKVNWEPT